MIGWLEKKSRPFRAEVEAASPATCHYWLYWDSLQLIEGVLFQKFHRRDGTGDHLHLIVPRKLKDELIYQMHKSLLSGYLGKWKTQDGIAQCFYWFGVRKDSDLLVEKCDTCAFVKKPSQRPQAPLGTMPVGAPLDRLPTDNLGPLPLTPRGNQYILLVTNHFTKWVEIFPVPYQRATTCAEVILNEVMPELLVRHAPRGLG